MKIKIEKGIAIPPSLKEKRDYPFNEMKIGESFFVETNKNNLYQQAHNYRKNNKEFNFVVRRDKTGSRVWRVK